MKLESPWLFLIQNLDNERSVYGGVLEFVAPDETVCVPNWMLDALDAHSAPRVKVTSVELPKGTYMRLKPINYEEFAQLENPKAV